MSSKNNKWLFPGVLVVFSIYYFFSAWVADDAYITFRTVENFHLGFGLRWNIIERVQTYTHPLWMFNLLLGKYLVDDLYYLSILLGFLYTSGSFYFLYRICRRNTFAFLLVSVVVFSSRAFIDFSSSGLENSLSYFLVTLFVFCLLFKKECKFYYFFLSIVLSMMFLNRMDLVLPFLPVAFYLFFFKSYKSYCFRKAILQGLVGFLPIILWIIFTLYYYGSFFPNSVVAKMNTGLPSSALYVQGISYLYRNFLHDPVTSVVIYSCLIYFLIFLKDTMSKLLGVGIFLYLIYLISVGADYMYGRFLGVPFLFSVAVFSGLYGGMSVVNRKHFYIGICFIPFCLFNFWTCINPGVRDDIPIGFADERQFYYPVTGLLPVLSGTNIPLYDFFKETQMMFESDVSKPMLLGNIGITGYLAAKNFPQKYIIDGLGLGDPFLSAHPMNYGYWRIGHFGRIIPGEYQESVLRQKNVIQDPDDHYVLDTIWLLTRKPLNTPGRMQAVIEYNTGKVFERARYAFTRYPPLFSERGANLWLGPYEKYIKQKTNP